MVVDHQRRSLVFISSDLGRFLPCSGHISFRFGSGSGDLRVPYLGIGNLYVPALSADHPHLVQYAHAVVLWSGT
ncbi:hypothetical protein D3C87_2035650 [compost metagenome]